MPIDYPDPIDWQDGFNHWVRLKAEHEAAGLAGKLDEIRQLLEVKTAEVMALQEKGALAVDEPDDLEGIRSLRPPGRRRIWDEIPMAEYRDRLEGALLGRCAGCTLGAPVEFHPIGKMERWADHIGDPFPPVRYWSAVERPHDLAYGVSPRWSFTPDRMDGVPTDDDIIYTLLDHGAKLGQKLTRFDVQFGMRAALHKGRVSRCFRCFKDLFWRRHASSSE